jgi:hypothetical protein
MTDIIITAACAFILGAGVGAKLIKMSWKSNARDYKGIDGFKVISMDFYNRIYENYMKYLGGGNWQCCAACRYFESKRCPVKAAEPWSRWGNYCSEFQNKQGEIAK